MSHHDAPRSVAQGVQILHFPSGPYIEVAERVRLVHKAEKSFSFDRGEVLRVHGRWLYRAYITVAQQQYIGDAEIHFGALPTTPDGTNPITCGQTSAVGNALAFAGFGNLKSVLARLGGSQESEWEHPGDAAQKLIEDIEIVLIDEQPYVTVAERLYFVHLLGKTFSIQQCKLIRYHDVWIYRAWITVDGHGYIGDAEVYFDALHEPDRTYPISCAQTSAIGNALAFAGFGDVRSILERWGKPVPETLEIKPHLASADAVLRGQQQGQTLLSRTEEAASSETRSNRQANAPQEKRLEQSVRDQPEAGRITLSQRERIRVLCERLGETEPDYSHLTEADAEVHLVQLQLSEEELLQALDAAGSHEASQGAEEASVSLAEVGTLKQAWLEAFHIAGTKAAKRGKWEEFKTRTCQVVVDDQAMRRLHYMHLLAAIVAEQERRATPPPVRQRKAPVAANGQVH